MDAVDKADLAGAQGHDHRRSSHAFAEEAHTLHQRAFGDARGGENQLLAGSQVFGFVDFVLVLDAHTRDAFFQFRLVDDQPAEHVTIQAADGGGRDDAFGRAARAHDGMHAGADDGGSDARRKIAIADQLDARARGANIGNQPLVTGTVEHNDDQILHVALQPLGNVLQVVRHRRVHLYGTLTRWADDNLFHVAVGRVQQAASFGSRQHRDGAGRARGAQICAFQRIDGDVHFGNIAAVGKLGPNFFADVEHGRFVALALADHDGAAHGHRVHGVTHGFRGHVVRQLAFTLAHGVGRGDRRVLHHAQEFQRQITFQVLAETFGFGFRSGLFCHNCLRMNRLETITPNGRAREGGRSCGYLWVWASETMAHLITGLLGSWFNHDIEAIPLIRYDAIHKSLRRY